MRRSLLLLSSVVLAVGAGCLDPEDPGNLVPKTVTEDPTLPGNCECTSAETLSVAHHRVPCLPSLPPPMVAAGRAAKETGA